MAALSLASRTSIASMATSTRAPAPAARTSLVVRASEAERRAANLDTRKSKTQLKHASIRHKIVGTAERPRLAVFRANKHMYAQVIDDTANDGVGHTMAHMSTLNKKLAETLKTTGDKTAAMEVGKALGALCKERGIETVVFDRGGFMYHGRVQAVAEGAREAGLIF